MRQVNSKFECVQNGTEKSTRRKSERANSPPWFRAGCTIKDGAAGWLVQEINLLINTTPALRATPPRLRRGILLSLRLYVCLLYTSDAADERSSVDLGGR